MTALLKNVEILHPKLNPSQKFKNIPVIKINIKTLNLTINTTALTISMNIKAVLLLLNYIS